MQRQYGKKMAKIPLSESYTTANKTDPLRHNFDKALHEKS
jgi:hypothetical protein